MSEAKPKQKSKSHAGSRAIRVVEATYRRMCELKELLRSKEGKKDLSHSSYIDALNVLAEAMLNGKELYLVDGKLYEDRAEAWGASVQLMVKGKVVKPLVLLQLGPDDAFSIPEQP